MDFFVEKIMVPDKHSFLVSEHELGAHTSKIHSHGNYELNFITHGWGRRYVGDNISSFQAGDLVLMGPDLPHCWEVKGTYSKESPRCIVIHFQEDFLGSDFINTPELKPVLELLRDSPQGLHFKGTHITDVRKQLEMMLESDGLKSLVGLLEIFRLLLEFKEYSYLSTPGYIQQSHQSDFKKINKIYEYIFVNFQQDITLEEVADLVNITPGALCRYFKNKTGKTLFSFLKEVRIGYACKLLNVTNKTVTEICYESGYNTLAHFNTQFKEIKGTTPGRYRKRTKNVLATA
ncbi:AraC family transcriptional regulator [Fodinibius sediminis]|uniref:Transcriptional regulator, AraC family n=1 Tax=Fodinibius sediminis TaxID=1214077 RepID=A0A521BTT0_9BACT|nr:AraC family transcriptional regulator [Fodinibius sediminis]SMO50558.1 transcriptional regulator, AraC family [Fodinibius sediminis]